MQVISSSTASPYTSAVYKVSKTTRQFQIAVVGSGHVVSFQAWTGTYNSSDNAFVPSASQFSEVLSVASSGVFVVSGVFDFVRFVVSSGSVSWLYFREVSSADAIPERAGLAAYVAPSAAANVSEVNSKINEILAALQGAGLMEGS